VRTLLILGVSATASTVRAGIAYLLSTKRRTRDSQSIRLSGWTVGSSEVPTLWSTFYAAQALIEYRGALEHLRSQRPAVRIARWRKYIAGLALAAFVTIVVILSIGAVLSGAVGTVLAALAAMASIVTIFPIVRHWFTWRRFTR
jgi:hypothetical protein